MSVSYTHLDVYKRQPQNTFHVIHHIGVAIVEIGLLRQERVHVILLAPRIPGKGRAAEHRKPVAGRRAIRARIDPDVPILSLIHILDVYKRQGLGCQAIFYKKLFKARQDHHN